MLTEDNLTFIRFALGGICNSCNDPINSKLFIENDAIELLCDCLKYDNDMTLIENNLLSLIYLLQDHHSEKELVHFNIEIVSQITKFTEANETNVKNLATILSQIIHKLTNIL